MPLLLLLQEEHAPATSAVLLDLLKLLAAAALVSLLLHRLRLATLPGYLITGALIGPSALGVVDDAESVQAIGRLAIILLMFSVGISLDLEALRGSAKPIILVGVISTAAAALAGWPVAMLFGLPPAAALAVAMAMTMSSSSISMRVLQERRELNRVQGRLSLGTSLVQDLLSVAVLALLPALALWEAGGATPGAGVGAAPLGNRLWELTWRGLVAFGGVILLIGLGRLVLPRLLHMAAATTAEVLLVLTAAIALGAAVATAALGFSPELGAFLAGFLLATTPFRYQIAGQLDPMRDLFMAVFFSAIGLTMDVEALASAWWVILLALGALFLVKGGIIGVSCWAAGTSAPVALGAALLLAQAGEFGLVVVAATQAQGLIDPVVRSTLIALIVLSLIVTPFAYDLGKRRQGRLASVPAPPWLRKKAAAALRDSEPAPEPGPDDGAGAAGHVVVAGFGVCGRAIVDLLVREGIPHTVIELNAATVRTQSRLGRSFVYGDVTNAEVLGKAGIQHADAVVLTIPDDDAMLRACRLVRSMAPHAYIAVRSSYMSRGMAARMLGADLVVVEEVATAEAMEKQVVARIAEHARARREMAGKGEEPGEGESAPPREAGGVSPGAS